MQKLLLLAEADGALRRRTGEEEGLLQLAVAASAAEAAEEVDSDEHLSAKEEQEAAKISKEEEDRPSERVRRYSDRARVSGQEAPGRASRRIVSGRDAERRQDESDTLGIET